MPASASRQLANRRNALCSTGPRTPQGQARSSQNALQHGLTARELTIAAEDRPEFDQMLAALRNDIQPSGAIQQTLFDEMVAAAWNLRRVRRMEAELSPAGRSYTDFLRALKELKSLQTDHALARTLPPDLTTGSPLASIREIAKRTQHLTNPGAGYLVKRMFEAIDNEAAALDRAYVYQGRVAELTQQLHTSAPVALAV